MITGVKQLITETQIVLPKYWYELFYEECMVCGSPNDSRVRHYGKKPLNRSLRVHYTQQYCGCLDKQWY